MTSAIDDDLPFSFTVQSTFLSYFTSVKVLSSNSDVKEHISNIRADGNLKKKWMLSNANQIDFNSRFRVFHSLP